MRHITLFCIVSWYTLHHRSLTSLTLYFCQRLGFNWIIFMTLSLKIPLLKFKKKAQKWNVLSFRTIKNQHFICWMDFLEKIGQNRLEDDLIKIETSWKSCLLIKLNFVLRIYIFIWQIKFSWSYQMKVFIKKTLLWIP